MKYFTRSGRERSGNFVDGQGHLETTWKVREKSGNLKIDSYGSLQKLGSKFFPLKVAPKFEVII